MLAVELDVVRLAVVARLEMMHLVYSGCVALLVLGSVSASFHSGVVLSDLVMGFVRMVLAETIDAAMLVAVVIQYFQVVVH
jgi:hypothetical protein